MSHHPLYTNRLVHEKSPYLLQHAHNPVDWYPWSDEAFRKARELNKPIFLSIGYATCHWCHVMEQETFQSLEIAELLNETFINIKVDREEKPEIDSLYMEFAQAMMSGGAGWPLNVILTPELMPFFAATYLPPDASRGFLGVKQLVLRISQIWADPEERGNVIAQAGKIVDIFATHSSPEGDEAPTKEHIGHALELIFKAADPLYGGMHGSPKFPQGFQAIFLLRLAKSTGDSRALFYVEKTLEMMRRGGIYDHLGGGFSRYSVDEGWLVPHFEKMIYDNAILAVTYLEAFQYTKEARYQETSREILDYILREMTAPEGGFYSAEDADSEGHEGRFYTWTWDEIHALLKEDAPFFCEFYGVSPHGNFEGRNILHQTISLEEFSTFHKLDVKVLVATLAELRKVLFEAREKRVRPLKDDKIISAWNGLAIYAFAEAGKHFGDARYLEAAAKGARFLKENLWKGEALYRRYRDKEAKFDGCLDDYACVIHGLISLFEADQGAEWLEFALVLANILKSEFKAPEGAFYLTNGKDPHLILRRAEFYDGAEPSGNGVHAENLVRLAQITGLEEYLQQAADILRTARQHMELYPPGVCYHLMALHRYLDQEAPTFVIALNDKEELKQEITELLRGHFIPHKAVVWRRASDEELRDLVPLARDKGPVDGKTTLYICHRNRCQEPLTDIAKIQEAFAKL